MKKILLVVALLLTAFAGCVRQDDTPAGHDHAPEPQSLEEQAAQSQAAAARVAVYHGAEVYKDAEVDRFIDADAGVLCYRVRYQAGLSCVPLSQTYLNGNGVSRYADESSAKH